MTGYISILRGINVGGQRKVPMAQLKALYESLGCTHVTTYIQSGNVAFEHHSAKGLQETLEAAIEKEFGFEVPVMLRTAGQLKSIMAKHPFLKEAGADETHLHVTFLSESPEAARLTDLAAHNFPPDQFAVHGSEIYLFVPGSYGHTKLSNAFFEKKLKVKATTRNWKTVCKLAEMARS